MCKKGSKGWWDLWSETTLTHWMMVERYPNLKEEVGSSIFGCEISFLLDQKTCQGVNRLMCFDAHLSILYLKKKGGMVGSMNKSLASYDHGQLILQQMHSWVFEIAKHIISYKIMDRGIQGWRLLGSYVRWKIWFISTKLVLQGKNNKGSIHEKSKVFIVDMDGEQIGIVLVQRGSLS